MALAYSEEHQSLISAGKKGAVCIWDVRQRSLRHRFQGSIAFVTPNIMLHQFKVYSNS